MTHRIRRRIAKQRIIFLFDSLDLQIFKAATDLFGASCRKQAYGEEVSKPLHHIIFQYFVGSEGKTCVRLFLEKGYKRTTVAEILKAANVSASTFQNIFHTKDGVFIELVRFMFDNQFNIALKYTEQNFPPVFIYALETSIQLTLTELNKNVREMYLEAYRQPQSAEYIYRHMAIRLYQTFHSYLPACTESDFYELEIGSSGIIRAYMARSCDLYFTLE